MIEFLKPFSTSARRVFGTSGSNAMICCGLIFIAGSALPANVRADPVPAMPDSPEVTNVVQLSRFGSQNPNVSHLIRLEGDVLWADPAQGKLVLQDASGADELEMELHGQNLQPGQRVRLAGESTI